MNCCTEPHIKTVEWKLQKFEELTSYELYTILRLRCEVFVLEQKSLYLDPDNKDLLAYHLGAWNGKELLAYSRLIPPGISFPEISLGRVVVAPNHRTAGLGRSLIKESIRFLEDIFGKQAICIGAQLYLQKFYESFGFLQSNDIYDEDGIAHIQMIRRP